MGSRWTDVILVLLCAVIATSVWTSPARGSRDGGGRAAGGFGARWDFIGVLPPYRLIRWWTAEAPIVASDSSGRTADPMHPTRSDLPSILRQEWGGVLFSVLHVVAAVCVLLSSSGPPPTAVAISMRLLLVLAHVIVLCIFGSVELGLHIGGSVLLPPTILEPGVHMDDLMVMHYRNAATTAKQPLASMFTADVAGLFVPSMVLSFLVIIAAMIDLCQLEDDFDMSTTVTVQSRTAHERRSNAPQRSLAKPVSKAPRVVAKHATPHGRARK
jgi:hypothetical protein